MHCGPLVKHTTEDVDGFLKADGLEPDTEAYKKEWARRYRLRGRKWVERDDWNSREPMPLYTYSPEEVYMVVRRREGDEPEDGMWNAIHRHFEPYSADINDSRMIMRGTRDENVRICSADVQHPPRMVRRLTEESFPKVGAGFAFVGNS